MSWFNTLMNRLFGPDDSSRDEIDYEMPRNEYEADETVEQSDSKQASSFRFPIISDAEIYGWDEELPRERETQHSPVNEIKAEDLYEPTPLYENERWSSDKTVPNVFRVGSASKYASAVEPERVPFGTDEKEQRVEQTVQIKSPIQKRSSRPFSPTSVPSPVFGYRDPRQEISPMVTEDEAEFRQMEEVVIAQKSIVRDDFAQQTALVDTTDTQPAIVETPIFVSDLVEHKSIDDEEESVVMESAEMEHTRDAFEKIETDIFTESTELSEQPERVTEQKQERIVPFNVLMLKSDKEKITRESSVHTSATAEKVLEPTQLQTEFQTEVEVAKEAQEQLSDHDEMVEEEPYYAFPSLNYLIPPEAQIEDTEWLDSQSEKLEEALSHFAVQATVIEAVQGPTVTRFELTVGQGTKVSKVRNLTDDLKLALAAEDIRIQAPIPGKSSIGIEIPNRKTRAVRISEVIATDSFQTSTSPLEAVLGLSLTGMPVTLDLRKMPHGMIAGATGSGKSVCINSILVSLLYKAAPTDLKMMLIDPKMVELAPFNGIPHLISPVITDVKAATAALKWAVAEMERRYELLAHAGVRDIERYNKVVTDSRRFSLKMPYLLIVIDELADLMMMAPADVEVSISRIAQKARACGIHLIIATQRPSVDVITGTIKANIPTRIAFSVSSQIDSRTIIDSPGAERLLGKGDMLYIGNGQSAGSRLQGTFVTDDEIERIIEHVRNEASPDYLFGQEDLLASAIEEEETDPLFEEVCLFVHEQGSASTSLLQRNFSIGYNRAAKLIDRMEKHGFISGQRGSKARDVFLTESDLDKLTDRLE
ncbi:DNA translocase FtsK [Sporosarcina beigongshangi]|uniref:DNA translocase FtsK n=1 Tax=Sporosarcina beigongshangi TaxID=2782538 RepID=UPI00193AD996|nr:DNA translocase FtsK [Sporosarcina beigongshangi]